MKRSTGRTASFLVAIAISVAPNVLSAQTHQPYAGLEAGPIKALSDEQIADLQAGRGMGMALPAELNGYPGPIHVLELADSIQLSDAQRTKVRQLFEAMQAEAVPLGEKLISQEGELDRLFAGRCDTSGATGCASQVSSCNAECADVSAITSLHGIAWLGTQVGVWPGVYRTSVSSLSILIVRRRETDDRTPIHRPIRQWR